jgi:DnaJ-domain-containing protein 1
MNGQLSEQPLAELIREISAKGLSGRLRLQHDNVMVVAYFEIGLFVYAASNVRTFRLREYLQKAALIPEQDLVSFDDRTSDLELAKKLGEKKLLSPGSANALLVKQVSDVLRLGLSWIEGTWEFDHRFHLSEELTFSVETTSLLLEAGRKISVNFAASRFRNPGEMISAVPVLPDTANLLPQEGFLLSRLERPMVLGELIALSGLNELEALHLIYYLAVAGFVQRENWKNVFRSSQPPTSVRKDKAPADAGAVSQETSQPPTVGADSIDSFLERVGSAKTHYEVLDVTSGASQPEVKDAYYDLARRYHPDRFRTQADVSLQARIDSAFARITQAYDTLREAGSRGRYDSKLGSRARVKEIAKSAPKATTPAPSSTVNESNSEKLTHEPDPADAENAELQFKEGYAALQLGQLNVATRFFGAAARLAPGEARYRAYYGHALATQESTRRLAEVELQAALKLEPDNAEHRIMLAELYRTLGFLVRAKSEAKRALGSAPNSSKARELLNSLE